MELPAPIVFFRVREKTLRSPSPPISKKSVPTYGRDALLVGLGGFEPPTPCPPDMYARPLRYSPMRKLKYHKDLRVSTESGGRVTVEADRRFGTRSQFQFVNVIPAATML